MPSPTPTAVHKVPAFAFSSLAAIVAEPTPLRWLVKGWFELDSLVMFFGDAASCKTWLVLAMAIHIAAGLPFFDCPVRQGAVFVIAGEGRRGLGRRSAGLMKHYGIPADVPLYFSETAAALTENQSTADVITAVRALTLKSGMYPVLIVIDTVSRNFGNADENSTKDMAQFIRCCDWVRNEFGCTVAPIHHVGHQDKTRARGNTTMRGALDAEYRVIRDEAGIIDVTCTKAKEFDVPSPRRFVLTNVPLEWLDDDGFPVTSAAIVPTDAEPVVRGKLGRGKNQTKALQILSDAYERHRNNLISDGRDPEGASVPLHEWRDLCKEAGISRFRMAEVERSLQNIGFVRVDNGHVRLAEGYV
jgi:hypothetical protein